ncbi:MAG: hypothetical protein F6K55_36590 [Moorea sp. SIO4A3]|nr:hypothetical protein [Moorena sp. SIO4A3]
MSIFSITHTKLRTNVQLSLAPISPSLHLPISLSPYLPISLSPYPSNLLSLNLTRYQNSITENELLDYSLQVG